MNLMLRHSCILFILLIQGCAAAGYVASFGSAINSELRFRELEERVTTITKEYVKPDSDIWVE